MALGISTGVQIAGVFFFPEELGLEELFADGVLPTPAVEDTKLQNVVNDLYKGATNPDRVGTGTTADAVRAEAETGLPTGGVFHAKKAEQYSNALKKLINGGTLSAHDQLVAQSLLDDLQAALAHRP